MSQANTHRGKAYLSAVSAVRDRLTHFKAPDWVYFEPLPKTSTGKIQKHVLRAVAHARTRDDGPAPARSSGTTGSPGGRA